MISRREIILTRGEQFKFRTAPVDPYDAFRGRYVALSIDKSFAPLSKGQKFRYGESVYALIGIDESGFAEITAVTDKRPEDQAYMLATVDYYGSKVDVVNLDLPIDRYYMEENAAAQAENIYREFSSRGKQDAYVSVRILNGLAVIESLFVGGQRIEDAVRQAQNN
jgi:uncharacterized membrane-anchored protein